nr:uncharacterized mitochondrial protein AtMg00810-like [Tanacetum cinerariifolium]
MSLGDMMKSSPICPLSKALKTKSLLWYRRLSHLNFGAINHLARQGLVRGLPKLKFKKDHLCSACPMGKSKKKSYKPKSEDTNHEKLYLLHIDLCGTMRVESVNGKKYILVIIDDYSRFTWVKCLRLASLMKHLLLALLSKMVSLKDVTLIEAARTISDITSKESTHQVVYDVLRLTSFYKAFLVTTDVPKIYMQEFRVTTTVHHHSIRFKMNNKKRIINLEYFREMMHICPIIPNQTFDELLVEEEILANLRYLGHSGEIKKITDQFGAMLPVELTNEDIKNFVAYKEYYVIDSRAAPPKTKASVRKTQSSFNTTLPPPTAACTLKQKVKELVLYHGFPMYQLMSLMKKYPRSQVTKMTKVIVDHPAPKVIAPIAEVVAPELAASTGLPSSTTVNQGAPSPISIRLQLHEQALFCYYAAFLTFVEPKTYKDALTQSCWIEAMQEELNEFERLETAFLNGNLRDELYVNQPNGYVDPDNPNHVYKLKKALYGLKQALRAWYDMLSSFLISQDFSKGSDDPTLFIRRNGNDLLLVQIYVDDIIFDASTPELCDLFAKIMCSKYKMSMMGKISFFLGLQISQSPRGIFINRSKYALESLKKYGFESCDPVDTPMMEKSKVDEDKEGKAVDPSHYHGMIGTLLNLTAIRSDLQFTICMSARYQARPTKKHLHVVKRIFRYLRGTVNQGLWYAKNSLIALTTFAYADHTGCQDTRRSTSGSMQFVGDRLISWSLKRKKIYHFIKEHVENGVIELYFVNKEYQQADIFTKALGRERIKFLINKLGMRSFTPETLQKLTNEVDK